MIDDCPPFDHFEEGDMLVVEEMAAGMSEQEIFDYFSIDSEADLDETEKIYFKKHYKKGKSIGKRKMVNAMMKAANMKGGGAVAASFLAKQGEEWKSDGSGAGSGTFSFTADLGGKLSE